MAGFYVFAMHTMNRYLDRDAIQFNDPSARNSSAAGSRCLLG